MDMRERKEDERKNGKDLNKDRIEESKSIDIGDIKQNADLKHEE